MSILSIENLRKNYGTVQALKDVSFDVPRGTVFGILGPNGSGKTTMLGIITDILRPTSGTYRLFDEVPNETHRRQIGTFLETPNFYHYLSGEKNLQIAAAIKERGAEDIPKVLDIVNLTQRKNSRFSTYSLGMKQRLAIASCLLGSPDVLILDEPTNGLDPVGIAETRELIKKLHLQGKTIIMASHLLDEVEKVCSHVAILKKGELVATGDVNEILASEDIIEIGAADINRLKLVIQQLNGYSHTKDQGEMLQLFYPTGTANLEIINQHCFNNGITLNNLHLKKKSLESKFMELDKKHEAGLFLKEMMDRLSWLPLNEFVYRPDLTKAFEVDANWALYCENYLEGFHIPFVHASLNAALSFGEYTTELYPKSILQLGIGKDEDDCFDLPLSSEDYGTNVAAYYFWVYPNMMFNFYPWGLSVNVIVPEGVNKTKVEFITYMWKEDKYDKGAGSNLDKVEQEDEEIVENVQKGVVSRFYNHGRYSVTRETGTHHFHRLIADSINH